MVQSFEEQALLAFKAFSDLPLIQSMRFGNSSVTYDLQHISSYALGVAP